MERNIHEMYESGHPARVAVAAALSNADRHPRRTAGGIIPAQAISRSPSGWHPRHYQIGGQLPQGAMNPQIAGLIQQMQQMTPQQLQAVTAQTGPNSPQGLLAQRILQSKGMPGAGTSPSTVAPAMSQPPVPSRMFARGGAPPADVSRGTTGFLHSQTPGRTDHLRISAPSGSYVVPADIVSGIGEGNSNAGAPLLMRALMMGPGKPKRPASRAKGGAVEGEPTPILAAGGELIVPPELVKLWGYGDAKRGNDFLDKWVIAKRKELARKQRKLPGPVKS